MIRTWVADIRPLLDETCYQEYYEHMPKFRQKKADALKLVQGKAQSIGVWYLYEQMKKEYGIQKDAAYNLSHSGEYVLCSVHEGKDPKIRVGCDIEEIGICNMKIARRFFCRSEYEKIDSETNEERRRELFFRYWVLKESFIKATREGMAMGLDTFEIALGENGNPSVLLERPSRYREPFYYMESATEDQKYRIAVCSTDEEIDGVCVMALNHKIESRMKKIMAAGLAGGLIVGVAATGIFTTVTGNTKEKEYQDKITSLEKELKNAQKEEEETGTDLEVMAQTSAQQLSEQGDAWQMVLVNESHPLDASYVPELAELEPDRQVDVRILEDAQQMLADARNAGLNPYVCSAYRNYDYQRSVFNDTMVDWITQGYTPLDAYDETKKSVAVPGTSEHATGLALDITSADYAQLDDAQADTAEAKWFAENCWKYGFILRYPPEKSDVTGIIYEPWHYRYVGKEAAKEITESGLTLEEYLEQSGVK